MSTVFSGHYAINVFVSGFHPTTLGGRSSPGLSHAGNRKLNDIDFPEVDTPGGSRVSI